MASDEMTRLSFLAEALVSAPSSYDSLIARVSHGDGDPLALSLSALRSEFGQQFGGRPSPRRGGGAMAQAAAPPGAKPGKKARAADSEQKDEKLKTISSNLKSASEPKSQRVGQVLDSVLAARLRK